MTINLDNGVKASESLVLTERKGAAVDIRFEGISYAVPQGKGKGMIQQNIFQLLQTYFYFNF